MADTEPDALARLMKFDERFYRLRRTVEHPRRAGADQGYAEQLEAIAPFVESVAGDGRYEAVEDHTLR